jgi:CHAT domain-containing protein
MMTVGARARCRLSQAIAGSSNATQGEKDARPLVPGQPIERELAGGEAHTYQITLIAGQYLQVLVEQRGIDVVATLYGPAGRSLTESDGVRQGVESISTVAEAPGTYRLEVRPAEVKAKSGRYEVTIKELRAATPQDRSRIITEQAAKRLLREGNQLCAQATAESRRQAIARYEEALALWQAADDQGGKAQTFTRLGLVYDDLGEKRRALDFYNQALPLSRAVGDRRLELSILIFISTDHLLLGEYPKVLDYCNQALPLARSVGYRQAEATAQAGIGIANFISGERHKALDHLNQALSIWQALGYREQEATMLVAIGGIYFTLGEKQKAREYNDRASQLRQVERGRTDSAAAEDKDRLAAETAFAEGVRLSTLGTAESRRQSIEKYEEALPLWRAIGDREREVLTLTGLGMVYALLGEKPKAIDYLNQALSLWRALGSPGWEGYLLSAIGETYFLLGEQQSALDYLRLALPVLQATGDRASEAFARSDLARIERDRGNLSEAQTQIEAALDIIESIRTRIVNPTWRLSYFTSEQGNYEFYIDLLMRLHRQRPSAGYDAAALRASERARARSLLELLTEARVDIRQGVEPVLLERERSLQQRLKAQAENQFRLFNARHTKEQAEAAKKEIERLLEEQQEIETQIREVSPHYAALKYPQPCSLQEIRQQALDADTLLLEYSLGEERSYLWAVSLTGIASFELPRRSVIEDAVRHLSELLTEPGRQVAGETPAQRQTRIKRSESAYWVAATGLSRMLLGPVAPQLGTKRLLVVGDGALQYLPFAALPAPEMSDRGVESKKRTAPPRPLILEHEIVCLPSASTLATLRRELAGRPAAPRTIAALADPVFELTDKRVKRDPSVALKPAGQLPIPRLAYSRREATGIVAPVPTQERKLILGFDVNHGAVTSADLADYRFVHFATHSRVDSAEPALSGILLSLVDEAGRPQENGILHLGEIYNLKLPAELVTLSACQTALGKEVKGEGLVGLTRGFMYAGAARVVASLWKVDDAATADLMKQFYQRMLGEQRLRPAAALRAAQIAMSRRKGQESPYYWAAFVIQGEWR